MRGHKRNEEVKTKAVLLPPGARLLCVASTSVSSPARLPSVIDTRLAQSPAIGTGADVNTD